jgi:hypothetical protein
MNDELRALEVLVDSHFERNPILSLPFSVLYNVICEIAALQLVEKGAVGVEFLTPLVFIFEKDLDLTPLSLDESRARHQEIVDLDPAFADLIKCANLNIVFPFIHAGIYTYKRIETNTSTVEYSSTGACRAELLDSVLSNLSVPMIPGIKPLGAREHWLSLRRRLDRRETPDVIRGINFIERNYAAMAVSYREAQLVPDEFYSSLGFSSGNTFRAIRQALCAICKAYMDTTVFVHRYAEQRNLDRDTVYQLNKGLAMAVLPRETIKRISLRLSGAAESDFEKFAEFFFEDGSTRSSISRRFLPPFWNLGGTLYFSPGAAFMLMSTRNLLISLQNHAPLTKKYMFHQKISQLFEPALLQRAKLHFEANGIVVALEKKIRGTDIDMLAYCERSNVILIIQAKATLYPEGARMVRNLDGRIAEAIGQIAIFDALPPEEKKKIINECFVGVGDKNPKQLNGILTNSSFGTYNSWQHIDAKKIVPLNCNILRHVLPRCVALSDLPEEIEKYIKECIGLVNAKILDRVFNIDGQTILQKNLDFDIFNLYKENLIGE